MIKAAKAYFKTQISTTTQADLLIMLYDGAIKFLTQAKERMAARDYAQKGILISKALDVIGELDGSLNAEKGGEVARNLHQLYFYCNTRLLRANLEMNTELVDETIRILSALRDAFDKIKDQAPTAMAAPVTMNAGGPSAAAPSAPTASAAQASAAYGRPAPAAAPAAKPAPAPPSEAPAAQQPQPPKPQAAQPGPAPVQQPQPLRSVGGYGRKPGLPGAYGNPGGTR